MRITLVASGNWAEGRGYLVKGGSPFPAMVRYKETKSAVSIFTPENIASLLTKADKTLRPFLAPGCFCRPADSRIAAARLEGNRPGSRLHHS